MSAGWGGIRRFTSDLPLHSLASELDTAITDIRDAFAKLQVACSKRLGTGIATAGSFSPAICPSPALY